MKAIKEHMKIAKRHTLRHYIQVVGELYSEKKEFLDQYIEDQVRENDHDLDKAIACFGGMLDKTAFHEIMDHKMPEKKPYSRATRYRGIKLNSNAQQTNQSLSQGRDHELSHTKGR